jgi:type VI secretion system protein ImpA
MTKPALIDFVTEEEWAALLAPISAESRCGDYLLYDDTYARIREARREDDPQLSQGDWKQERKRADWDLVEQACRAALTGRSKDLQLAAWLTEAWIYRHGMAGLCGGLHLLLQLAVTYWDDVHPPLEPADPEQRLSPFIWMNEKFYLPLGRLPLSAPTLRDVEPYSFFDREEAWKLELGSRAEKEAEKEGKPIRSRVLNSMNFTPTAFYRQLSILLAHAQEVLAELSGQLDQFSGRHAPSFGKLAKQLTGFQHVIQRVLGERPEEASEAPAEGEAEAGEGALAGAEPVGVVVPGLRIGSRNEAYQRLAEVAEYLLRTEPHSPTPYLIKRAISWGNLSLGELLLEIVNDERDLMAIYSLLGIPMRSPEG